MQMDHIYFKQF